MNTPEGSSGSKENIETGVDKNENESNPLVSLTSEAGPSSSSQPEISSPTSAPVNTFPSDLEVASSADVRLWC